MRLAHAADIHLGHRQYGLSQREVDGRLSFQKFLSQAREHDADAILIPGDLFDSRDIRPETLQQTEDILENVDKPIIVSPGNHDQNMSRRRSLTWLQYLNNRGIITLLSADLTGDQASFVQTDADDPRKGGGGYVDLKRDGNLVRCFGLQYRGAYIERDLPAVADGIRTVNDTEDEPDVSILLAHFGVDDAVPDLGANVARSALTDIEDLVDYIALGHIHKQYESGDAAHNPGSLEAFDIQEGRWSDEHGYYIYDTETGTAEHHLSKRRPYVTLDFDVSGYRTFEDLRGDFEDEVADARSDVEGTCQRSIYRDGNDGRRSPLINLRLEGTLLLDHATFDVETLTDIVEKELDALYTQPTNHTERKAVQELLGDLERDEAFNPDGTVNTDALQERVFTTIAGESRYNGETNAVAETLDRTENLVNEDSQSTAGVAEYLRERRRELFPDGAGAEDDEEVVE
ncbi:metallophosphoesterase family protein [Halovivax cerinus]|uniref:Exonuclease SbcCD subunit D n=1 Tax=Halovivax cerinus TaxID=1487865 RepID=A0ABD5NLA7_9EURY|nr:DNA repair exonuclease [Halovivax cerinus]